MTHNSLRLVIVNQALLPKIAVVKQPYFILMVLQGSYTYLWGPIKEFYSTDWGRYLKKLRLVIFTKLQQQFVV